MEEFARNERIPSELNFFEELRKIRIEKNDNKEYVLLRDKDEVYENQPVPVNPNDVVLFGEGDSRDPYGSQISVDEVVSTLGLDSSEFVLTPDEEQVATFAAANFFFGLLGITVSNFAAIPAGIVASYEKDGEFYGTFMTYEPFIRETVMSLINEKLENKDPLSVYYRGLYKILYDNKDAPLIDSAIMAMSYINEHSQYGLLDTFKKNLERAVKKYDEVNLQNCDDNDLIIASEIVNGDYSLAQDIYGINAVRGALKKKGVPESLCDEIVEKCVKLLATKRSGERNEEEYQSQLRDGYAKFNQLMDKFILPGYFSYRGRNTEQKAQVLNEAERVETIMDIIGVNREDEEDRRRGLRSGIVISNICSTDYSADPACDIVKGIMGIDTPVDKSNVGDVRRTILAKVNPPTPYNTVRKQDTKDKIYETHNYK